MTEKATLYTKTALPKENKVLKNEKSRLRRQQSFINQMVNINTSLRWHYPDQV